MKVQPLASNQGVSPGNVNSSAQSDARERAIAKLVPQAPVSNPSQVAPEEMSAINSGIQVNDEEKEGQAGIEEDTSLEQVEEAPKDTALTRQFAILAKQEKIARIKAQQLKQQTQSLQQREDALKAREAALVEKPADYSNYISKDRIKEDALQVLSEAGLSYDELTQQLMNQQPANPRYDAHISRLEAKIAELEKGTQAQQKSYQESQQQQYQQAVKQIKMDTQQLVKADPNFEAIRATNSVQDVVDLITSTYEKDGILMTVEEAANEVENYLIEEATKLTKLEKIKKQMQTNAQQSARPSDVKTPATKPQTQQMKTLTNATSSSRPLTAKERAILAFKGELKS